MPDVLLTETTQILSVAEEVTQILSVAEQGPPGEPGPPGPVGDAGGALLVTNRLSELAADPAAQAQALANLGITTVDGGTFF